MQPRQLQYGPFLRFFTFYDQHSPRHSLRLWLLLVILLVPVGAAARELQPRQPLPKEPVKAPPISKNVAERSTDESEYRLIVKLRDDLKARATSRGSLMARSSAELGPVDRVANRFGMVFSPLIQLPEQRLLELEQRAAAHSGIAQPDLAGIFKIEMQGVTMAELESAGNALLALPEVEFAYIESPGGPPPGDVAPPTPDLTNQQTYFGPNPGVDIAYAWSLGLTGAGIRLSDIEYGWEYEHEDLIDKNLNPEPGQTIHPYPISRGWHRHGTAVIGQTSAVVNGYGIDGMVPDAEIYTYPQRTVEEGHRRATAVANATANSSVGDVILLEMQEENFGVPIEFEQAVWTVVKLATDAGIVVVAAAGNGNKNLDSVAYADYMARGDSGAIIVGASDSNIQHPKRSDSTYGSRVDVNAWGDSVFTLGYGNYLSYGDDPNQTYTHEFGGTSAASPFVAAAAVAIQQAAGNNPLTSREMRDLLVQTGIPQGSGGHIGPFINLRAALEQQAKGGESVGPWQDIADGNLWTGIPWNLAAGYHFTPQVSGKVVGLGGQFDGTKIVRLFNKTTGALLAETTVTSANDWAYAPIIGVPVQVGTTYTVAVYLAGSGGSYRTHIVDLPRDSGPLTIEASTFDYTSNNPNQRPTRNIYHRMYGQADVQFLCDNPNDCGPVENKSISPLADAWVDQQEPNINFGSDLRLRTQSASSGSGKHAYLKFRVLGITPAIRSAKLRIRTDNVAIPSTTVYHIGNTTWGEGAIKWSNAPTNFLSSFSVGPMPADSWVEIDVSSIITGNGTYTIGLVSEDATGYAYRSRESPYKPTLEVVYKP